MISDLFEVYFKHRKPTDIRCYEYALFLSISDDRDDGGW